MSYDCGIQLLDEVIDSVTGFQGLATGIAFYSSGSPRALVEARVDLGKEPASAWFDVERLNVISRRPGSEEGAGENSTDD